MQILAYVWHPARGHWVSHVGTMEHALTDKWMVDMAYEIQKECERLVHANPGERKLECGCGINETAAVIGALPAITS